MFRSMIFATVLLLVLSACGTAADRDKEMKEKEKVIKVIETNIRWCFPEKDRGRLLGAVSHDPSFFMFQPDSKSTITGYDHFSRYVDQVFMVDECNPIGTEIKEMRVVLSSSGDVAWFSCLLDDWGEWAGQPWNWKDVRWTGVLQKTGGTWVMMQQHFSKAEDLVRAEALEAGAETQGQ